MEVLQIVASLKNESYDGSFLEIFKAAIFLNMVDSLTFRYVFYELWKVFVFLLSNNR